MTDGKLSCQVLLQGEALGALLKLDRPLSFWGGVDPQSGVITDPRHPQYGENVAGRILAMERTIGSSSGSSIMLELLSIGKAPAGLIMTESDAILTLGIVVARELGLGSIPVFLVAPDVLANLTTPLQMTTSGHLIML